MRIRNSTAGAKKSLKYSGRDRDAEDHTDSLKQGASRNGRGRNTIAGAETESVTVHKYSIRPF